MTRRNSDKTLPTEIVEHLLEGLQPIELSTVQRDRMRQRVLSQARASVPEGTKTERSADARWVQVAPFIEVRELSRDEQAGTHVSLMRMQPGGVIEPHRHSKEEEFLVLEGECDIGNHKLRIGDLHRASVGSMHGRVTTRSGVLVLVRGEFPYPG